MSIGIDAYKLIDFQALLEFLCIITDSQIIFYFSFPESCLRKMPVLNRPAFPQLTLNSDDKITLQYDCYTQVIRTTPTLPLCDFGKFRVIFI
jgi:hypothetical protein